MVFESPWFDLAWLSAFVGYIGVSLSIVNIVYLRNMTDLPRDERRTVQTQTLALSAIALSGYSLSILFLEWSIEDAGIRIGLLTWIPVCIAWILSWFVYFVGPDEVEFSWFRWSVLNLTYGAVVVFTILFVVGVAHSLIGWP